MLKTNYYQLTRNETQKILGGRDVEKFDDDGDGKWDRKLVYRNDGSLKKIVTRH